MGRGVSTRKRTWDLKWRKALGQKERSRDTVYMVQVQRGPGGVSKWRSRWKEPSAAILVGYIGFIAFQSWGERTRNLCNHFL